MTPSLTSLGDFVTVEPGGLNILQRALCVFRPHNALIFLGDRRQAFVYELLHTLTPVGLRGEDVAFRIGGNAVDAVEFTGLASSFSEAC